MIKVLKIDLRCSYNLLRLLKNLLLYLKNKIILVAIIQTVAKLCNWIIYIS